MFILPAIFLFLNAVPSAASGLRVARCDAFRAHGLAVSAIQRTSAINCATTRKLIEGTYRIGPESPTRKTKDPSGSGRPDLYFRGGWICSTGAGGVGCRNLQHRSWNVISSGGTVLAILANTS